MILNKNQILFLRSSQLLYTLLSVPAQAVIIKKLLAPISKQLRSGRNLSLLFVSWFISLLSPGYAQTLPSNDSLKIIEKVYLHLDRDIYYPGDNIWFKAYLVEAEDLLLSDYSSNLHVELISPASKILDSRIVRLTGGLGNGDFLLPGNLPSGRYRIRAYTNYMRNFGNQLFFNKEITLINSSYQGNLVADSIHFIKNKIGLSFFPEGGSLVENVTSVVAFIAVNALGAGCEVKGTVYTSMGDTITTFRSMHNGMGKFVLKPLPGMHYYAIANTPEGDTVKQAIPESFKEGVVLSVARARDNQLPITLKTNAATLSALSDHPLILTVSARNMEYERLNFSLPSQDNFYNIPTNDLPVGIVMLTVSGMNNLPLCERLVFIPYQGDIRLRIQPDKPVYASRDSVSLKISLADSSGIAKQAFLSLSVADEKFTKDSASFASNISSWFLLESDVHGPVEEPSYYFDATNRTRLEDLDLLLCTQGWRDFKWKYDQAYYPLENGFSISGRVRKLFSDLHLENAKVNIAICKKENTISGILSTDSLGRFLLKGIDLTGDAMLIASAVGKKDRFKGWLILDSMKYAPTQIEKDQSRNRFLLLDDQTINDNNHRSANLTAKENLGRLLKDSELKKSIKKKYKLSDTIEIPGVEVIAKRRQEEHIRSSRTYYLSPDKELIVTPKQNVKNNTTQMIYTFFPGLMNQRKYKNVLYMLNGNRVDHRIIEGLTIESIDRVDILNTAGSLTVFGNSIALPDSLLDANSLEMESQNQLPPTRFGPVDAAINVITKLDWTYTNDPVYHTVNTRLSGYNEARIFYSPVHNPNAENEFKPDLRNTLFWKPDITANTDKDMVLHYFNADNPSIIKVRVEGITSNGIPVTAHIEYEVK